MDDDDDAARRGGGGAKLKRRTRASFLFDLHADGVAGGLPVKPAMHEARIRKPAGKGPEAALGLAGMIDMVDIISIIEMIDILI